MAKFPTFIDCSIRRLSARESLQAKCLARPENKHFIQSYVVTSKIFSTPVLKNMQSNARWSAIVEREKKE